jgi:hypothetical protein
MLKQIFLAFLLTLVASFGRPGLANDKSAARVRAKPSPHETALIEETQAWAQRADFWRMVARGETLAEHIEVLAIKSNLLEAWVCGATKVCVSTRLLREFSPEEQHAVIAHEIGHLLIPRNYAAHPQLWEAQCDLFAATLLRDAEQVKQMLGSLAADCATCSDALHPKPLTRLMLVELFSNDVLTKVLQFDEFRGRSYAVQFKIKSGGVPAALKQLSFALPAAARNVKPKPTSSASSPSPGWDELKQLDFAIGFDAQVGISPRKKP